MLPVIRLFGISIETYPLTMAAAAAVFWFLSARALKRDFSKKSRLLLPPALLVSAPVGARLLHAALHPTLYGEGYPLWRLSCGRFYLMGGLALGVFVLYAVCREFELTFFRAADDVTFGAGAALAILKAGCFMNGCCGGKPTESALGMVFPARRVLYDLLRTPEAARRVWPVQLFECAAYLLGIAALLLLSKRAKLPEGGAFLVYAFYVSAVRLALNPLRDFTYSQAAAKIGYPVFYLVLLTTSAGLLIRQYRARGEQASPPA